MGLNGSIEGSNPSFSASAAPAAALRPPAEGWQSGRMRRSRKPLSVVRRIEGSNPSPSAPRAESGAGNRVVGTDAGALGSSAERTGTSRDPLRRGRTGARQPLRWGSPWTEEIAAEDDLEAQIPWRTARAAALASPGSVEKAESFARQAVALAEPTGWYARAEAHLTLARVPR
jgi:hypothetical protein